MPNQDGRGSVGRRAQIATLNRLIKRKYPKGTDSKSRLYTIWKQMNARCGKPSHHAYARYGGRGIAVCAAWADFATFRQWAVNAGYAVDLTIDRIDNDSGYEPSNCRWITLSQQQSNRSNNVFVAAFGETKTVSAWSQDERCAVSGVSLYRRIRQGRDAEWAITAPPRAEVIRQPMSVETKRRISEKAKARQRGARRNGRGQYVGPFPQDVPHTGERG